MAYITKALGTYSECKINRSNLNSKEIIYFQEPLTKYLKSSQFQEIYLLKSIIMILNISSKALKY